MVIHLIPEPLGKAGSEQLNGRDIDGYGHIAVPMLFERIGKLKSAQEHFFAQRDDELGLLGDGDELDRRDRSQIFCSQPGQGFKADNSF